MDPNKRGCDEDMRNLGAVLASETFRLTQEEHGRTSCHTEAVSLHESGLSAGDVAAHSFLVKSHCKNIFETQVLYLLF